jgi:hypothetical protein
VELKTQLLLYMQYLSRVPADIFKLGNTAESDLASPGLSVCPHGTTRLPLDRVSRNLITHDFSNICHSSFITTILMKLEFSR